MNPALTPLSRIKEMTNTELVAFAKEHSHLTILEREFVKRMETQLEQDARRQDINDTINKDAADWYSNMRSPGSTSKCVTGKPHMDDSGKPFRHWVAQRMGDRP